MMGVLCNIRYGYFIDVKEESRYSQRIRGGYELVAYAGSACNSQQSSPMLTDASA
jgi:hypothetical protein